MRLAPSSLLCAQTGRACPGLCARGPVAARVGRRVRAWGGGYARAWDCARGPVDDGARLSLALEVQECARGPVAARVGPFTGSGNPFLRSWALLVAVWAACLDYHQWG